MKRFLSRAGHLIRMVTGGFCGLCTAVAVFMCFSDRQQWVVYLIMVVLFGLPTVLLLRKKRAKPTPVVSDQHSVVPVEVVEPVDAYIEAGGVVYRTDGQPISDREVPYLIETGLQGVILREQNNPLHRSDAEQELIFKFTERYGSQSDTLASKFETLASTAYKTDDLDEKVALLTAALQHFQAAREWHYKTSKGGMMWFQDMWENNHPWAKIEAAHLEGVLLERDYIRPHILERAAEGFIQKDIYTELPDADKSEVQRVLRQMEKAGQIIRTKKGGSYLVELPQ